MTRSIAAALADSILGIASTGNMSLTDMLISAADATQYNVEVFNRIESHLNNIAPSEAEELLEVLDRPDISQLAMDLVRGNPKNVTVESVTQLTKVIKSRLESEARSKVAAEHEEENKRAALIAEDHQQFIAAQQSQLNAVVESLKSRHALDCAEISDCHSRGLRATSSAQLITTILAAIVAVLVGLAVYIGTYYTDYLASKAGYRLFIAVVCSIAAGFPLLGLPAVGRWVDGVVSRIHDNRISSLAFKCGYEVSEPTSLTADELKILLDQQFGKKLSEMTAPSVPKAPKSDLFA